MVYYHRVIKIGNVFFIEKDRENDLPMTYSERINVPFVSREMAIASIDGFRSNDDDNRSGKVDVVYEGV